MPAPEEKTPASHPGPVPERYHLARLVQVLLAKFLPEGKASGSLSLSLTLAMRSKTGFPQGPVRWVFCRRLPFQTLIAKAEEGR